MTYSKCSSNMEEGKSETNRFLITKGIIFVITLIWAVWIGFQYFTKSGEARNIITQLSEAFYTADSNIITQKLGMGFEFETAKINGHSFWIRREFSRKYNGLIEMSGRVNFIQLVPFTDFRAGYSFCFNLKLE